MERLTRWINGKEAIGVDERATLRDVLVKLAEYEDAEEQGLLIKLPCKVGDTIYKLWYKPCRHGETHPDSFGCCGCEDKCDMERAIFEEKAHSIKFIVNTFLEDRTNCVYFLTREEAEQALAKNLAEKEEFNKFIDSIISSQEEGIV